MAYLDRIATEHPADLIAAEVPGFLYLLERDQFPTVVWKGRTRKQAAANQAKVDAIREELREIWRLAKRGDDAWRERLAAINTEYRGHNKVASVRWARIIEHAPRR